MKSVRYSPRYNYFVLSLLLLTKPRGVFYLAKFLVANFWNLSVSDGKAFICFIRSKPAILLVNQKRNMVEQERNIMKMEILCERSGIISVAIGWKGKWGVPPKVVRRFVPVNFCLIFLCRLHCNWLKLSLAVHGKRPKCHSLRRRLQLDGDYLNLKQKIQLALVEAHLERILC